MEEINGGDCLAQSLEAPMIPTPSTFSAISENRKIRFSTASHISNFATMVVSLDEPGVVSLDEPGVVSLDEPGVVSLDEPGVVSLDEPRGCLRR
jgi:hypothetical protein